MGTSKLVDINGLTRYHKKLKDVLKTKQDVIADLADIRSGAAKGATALQSIPAEYVTETELEGKGYATTTQVNAKQDTLSEAQLAAANSGITTDKVSGYDSHIIDTDIHVTTGDKAKWNAAEKNAKDYADGLAKNYDAAGTAAGLNTAMDTRVKVLEAIDHDKLAADASADAVAKVLDGAPEKFNTLKEIAAWIAEADTAEDAASLVTRVSALEAIDHNAYKAADVTTLASAKSYADGLASNYAAASHTHATSEITGLDTALDGKAAVDHNHDTVYSKLNHTHIIADVTGLQDALDGKAASSHTHAIADVTGLQSALDGKETSGAAAQALEAAKGYVDGKGYITESDLLFATESEIDALFAQ